MASTLTSASPAGTVPARSVGSNFAWSSAGNAVFAACQWAMVSALAKLGNPEMVGLYSLGIAVATPPLMLAQLSLRSVLATDVSGESAFRNYRDLRAISLMIGLFVVALIAVPGHTAGQIRIIVLSGLMVALPWMSDIYQGLMQAHERMDRIAVSVSLSGVVSLAALAGVVRWTGSLEAGLIAVVLGRLLVLVFYDALAGMRGFADAGAGRSSRGQMFGILGTAIPLGVVLMIGSLSPNMPRYFIAHEIGTHGLGIFSAIASLTAAGNLLVNALGQAATPRLAKLYAAGDLRGFEALTLRLNGIGVLLGAGGVAASVVIGPQVLTLLFGPVYAAHSDLLLLLAAGAAAIYIASLLGYTITACRRFREQVPLQIVSMASTALACWLLVPRYGLKGAALALTVSAVVQALGEGVVLYMALAKRSAA